jgi:putative selenate reductase
MVELRPQPIGALLRRAFRELDERDSIYDLPRRKWWTPAQDADLSARWPSFHGSTAPTPLGPAAGPQSQLAQNLVLSWLGGCRIHELKTVQVNDQLELPRPCIDMQTIGFNVEWSQELRLEQSLEEYVKGAMLVRILTESGACDIPAEHAGVLWDMSVGYDLAGIKSETVDAFLRGMRDCSAVVDRLRDQLPPELAAYRDLDYERSLSDTLTLSTFHGCPPDEIERIVEYLLDEHRLHCVVKLNPMLLGPERCRELLTERMGYEELHVPDTAFERDTRWEQAVAFCERLGDRAERLGLGFGVKFTNTLIVENHRDFFPEGEREMYLSGQPLHVLAMNLVGRFRAHFGDRFPISFSAGIDRGNFAQAAALGLVPITVCSDLLRPGGYARASGYLTSLEKAMRDVGARDLGEWTVHAMGAAEAALERAGASGDRLAACRRALEERAPLAEAAGPELFERWVSEARLANTASYVESLEHDERYTRAANSRVPKKIGSHLELFDCITCDKCVPVCPNAANFTFPLPEAEEPVRFLAPDGAGGWTLRTDGTVSVSEKHQIANFADWCNECGNCDVFCPEDGGPYLIKPRFFGTPEDWELYEQLDGFCVDGRDGTERLRGRFDGRAYALGADGERALYEGPGFRLRLDPADPVATAEGDADGEVDLTYLTLLGWVRDGVLHGGSVNPVNSDRPLAPRT